MHRAATSAVPHYRMWRQQITRASEAQERVVQAGVAFPADAEPAEVVQPGERGPPPSARGRVPSRGRCSGGRSPVSRLGATVRDGTCRGHGRDRRSQSESGDLVAERRGQPTCGAGPARHEDRHGHRRKGRRPPPSAVTPGKPAQNPGKRGRRTQGQRPGNSLQTGSFQRDGRTTENRGVPGSSPGLAI
jgi:hypothetical protein